MRSSGIAFLIFRARSRYYQHSSSAICCGNELHVIWIGQLAGACWQ